MSRVRLDGALRICKNRAVFAVSYANFSCSRAVARSLRIMLAFCLNSAVFALSFLQFSCSHVYNKYLCMPKRAETGLNFYKINGPGRAGPQKLRAGPGRADIFRPVVHLYCTKCIYNKKAKYVCTVYKRNSEDILFS